MPFEKYIDQLLEDIANARDHITWPYVEPREDWEWVSPEEEERTAPVRELEVWTGIRKDQLPPPELLSDADLRRLLDALKEMLNAYNCSFVLQFTVPERLQYAALRDNFDQEVKVKLRDYGFFELCRPGTEHQKCALREYCHCAWFAELTAGWVDVELTPEEEREMELRIEIKHLQNKYGSDWMKYYPYYLDPDYDDELDDPGDDDNEDQWWRE